MLDDEMLLRIGFECEGLHHAERQRQEAERHAKRFAERWESYNAVAMQLPLSERAGMFGPHMTPLTERAEQFLPTWKSRGARHRWGWAHGRRCHRG